MSIDKNTNEGKNYRNNVVKSTSGTSKSRINTGFPENISVLSPMMREYCKTKESYKDCILFYRLGDFYEMFFDDAILVSKELELTLTGKDCGLEERAPMCGIPFHAAETYIKRLIEKGHKVAICTDCHFVAFLDQSFDICLGCMKWNSAHRSTFFQSAVLTSKRQFQFFGYKDCIIKKHLIKVAKSIEQDAVLVTFFCFTIFPHHR